MVLLATVLQIRSNVLTPPGATEITSLKWLSSWRRWSRDLRRFGGDRHLPEEMQVILQPTLTERGKSNNTRRAHAHSHSLWYTSGEGKVLSKHQQEGKCCTQVRFHAGWRLSWRCKDVSLRGVGFLGVVLHNNNAKRRNRVHEVKISVTTPNCNWLPQIFRFTLPTRRSWNLSGSTSLTCSLLSLTCCCR